jgi:hypothetical protein
MVEETEKNVETMNADQLKSMLVENRDIDLDKFAELLSKAEFIVNTPSN